MNYLKYLSLFLLFLLGKSVYSQLELDRDANHELSYDISEDTLYIYVDVFNDYSIDLDDNGTLEDADDYVFLMWDLNANETIDASPSLIDIYYSYDSTQSNNLCTGHLVSGADRMPCSGSSGGFARVKLLPTANNPVPHVFYTFGIPKSDITFGDKEALCGRVSTEVHTGGTPMASSAKFPTYSGTDTYFIDPYNPVRLYPEAVITLPNGEQAPDDVQFSVCAGDSLSVYEGYPFHFWFGLSESPKQVIHDLPADQYWFRIEDPNDETCVFTDTVDIFLLDNDFCLGDYIFPNAVSPNGDGINDIFELIKGLDSFSATFWRNSKLKVYNRWGIKVFESRDDSNPKWDLRLESGKLIPVGTYFYTYNTPGDESKTVNGYFQVLHEE